GHRSKTPALNQDRLFVEDFGRLNRLAIRLEHHGIRQTLADQLQTHQSVINVLKEGPGKFDHVHFNSSRSEIFLKRRDQLFRLATVQCTVKKIYSDHAKGFLLFDVSFVKQADVNNDLAWLATWLGLKSNPEPAVR